MCDIVFSNRKGGRMNHFGFDLDGTIFNTEPILRSAIMSHFHYDIYNDHKSYKLSVPGISDDNMKDFIRMTIIKDSEGIHPYHDSVECLNKIYDKTRKPIVFVTARHSSTQWVTHKLITDHIKLPYTLDFIPEVSKREFLLCNGIKIWVDDNIEVLNHVCEYNIKGYLLERRWNKYKQISNNGLRVRSLTEICKIFKIE